MTSSSGASSTFRSTIGSADSARPTTSRTDEASTCKTTPSSSSDTTRPPMASTSPRATGRSKRRVMRLSGRMSCTSSSSAPSYVSLPVVDDDDARAERRHVLHVVARQDHRGPVALVVRAHEPAHAACIVTSRPIVGSSRKSTFGRWMSAAASSHFIRSPSESWRVGFCTRSAMARSSTSSSSVRRTGRAARRRWRD